MKDSTVTNSTELIDVDVRLAIAIGWPRHKVRLTLGRVEVQSDEGWRVFEHSDWNVIGPIATRYICFPNWYGRWHVSSPLLKDPVYGCTPQTAMAKAAIEIIKRRAAIQARSKK